MNGKETKFKMLVDMPGRTSYTLDKHTMACVLDALKALDGIEHITSVFMRPPEGMLFLLNGWPAPYVLVCTASSQGTGEPL